MTAAPWTVVVHHNGQPITGHVPLDAWATASILAQILAPITGRPISVMAAAHAAMPAPDPDPVPDPQLTIYGQLEGDTKETA